MATNRIYFSGLNGIRAIAALSVVFAHTGQYLYLFGLEPSSYYLWHWQSYSVTLFFVLSGFLITYLLLEEKSRVGNISLKAFYLRRVLRIWPLYFLVVVLTVLLSIYCSFFLIPVIPSQQLVLYGFMLANVASLFVTEVTPLSPLWSIGVEEQFYAVWPLILKRCGNALYTLLSIIGVYLVCKGLLTVFAGKAANALIAETRIDCMAIGGIGAVMLREKWRCLRYLYSTPVQLCCWAVFLYSAVIKPIHVRSSIDHELYSIVFVIIIINVSSNAKPVLSLENKFFDFFGKISYGLYSYHMIIIFLLRYIYLNHISEINCGVVGIYCFVIFTTVIVSYISYRFFELPFLKIKDKFSTVLSQASASR